MSTSAISSSATSTIFPKPTPAPAQAADQDHDNQESAAQQAVEAVSSSESPASSANPGGVNLLV